MEHSESLLGEIDKKSYLQSLQTEDTFATDTEYHRILRDNKDASFSAKANNKVDLKSTITFEALEAKKALQKTYKENSYLEKGEAHKEFVHLTNTLQHSTYDGADSPDMQAVKGELARLTNFLTESVGDLLDESKLQEGVSKSRELYTGVIDKCNAYIGNKNPWSPTGKARLEMVRDLKERCIVERSSFELTVRKVSELKRNDSQEFDRPINCWSDILFYSRAERLDKYGNKTATGMLSDVHKIQLEGGEEGFYQETHKLRLDNFSEVLLTHAERMQENSSVAEKLGKLFQKMEGLYADSKEDAAKFAKLEHAALCEAMLVRSKMTDILKNREFASVVTEELRTFFTKYETQLRGIRKYVMLGPLAAEAVAQGFSKIHPGANMTDRNLATSRVAELLKVSDVIAKSKAVFVHGKGVTQVGNLMETAKGKAYKDMIFECLKSGAKMEYTPQALKQLQQLQMMDMICGQTDRNPGNYFVDYQERTENGKKIYVIKGVKGIDNDVSFGQLSESCVSIGANYMPGLKAEGNYAFKRMDKQLYENIQALDVATVFHNLVDLDINEEEKQALQRRLEQLKTTLADMKAANADFLMEDSEWQGVSSIDDIFATEDNYAMFFITRVNNDAQKFRQILSHGVRGN